MRSSVLLVVVLCLPLFGEEQAVDSVDNKKDTIKSIDTGATQTEEANSTVIQADRSSAVDATDGEPTVDLSQRDTTQTVVKTTTVKDSIGGKKVEVTENKDVTTTSSVKKIKLRKRKYNYRQQVILAVGMMAFIAIMMTTAQSLNPN